jgi:hypothetical protein
MQDFEKLGVFYLGRRYDLDRKAPLDDLLLYDSKDLTTHAVCVGMTGSGKTGLCLALLEEAAIDGIPAIIIDPKGDLGNLLLAFPDLKPDDFKPWLDPADAARKGMTLDELAKKSAAQWRDGLAEWGQDAARIRRYRDAVDVAVYTPGGSNGLPLTVLRSFTAPPEAIRNDSDAMRERVQAAVSGLLALVGVAGDSLRSREHILLATIVDRAWRAGTDLDLGAMIRQIQQPPFDKVGFLDLESFFPAKERFELSMSLNNLLASPGFQAWMEGDPLDVQRLLFTAEGKPRLSILSIAHLADSERMFFVTILLNEVIAWMRSQSGTSSLRALLYMDEVFGYFPPTANPPSKTPMLTLLKQARAFGLGVVLATQNPVDLDYKGLSNCGTWFLGRLQTERDKNRVLDGLEGASTAAGANFDRSRMEKILSGLGNRVFLMNNVHDDEPVVFQSRWALSFLRGPLSREQIASLMKDRKAITTTAGPAASASSVAGSKPTASVGGSSPNSALRTPNSALADGRPVLPPDVPEAFIARKSQVPSGGSLLYRPALLGSGRVHFVSSKEVLDEWRDVHLLALVNDDLTSSADAVPAALWDEAEILVDDCPDLVPKSEGEARYAALPNVMTQPKKYGDFSKALKEKLYRSQRFTILKCAALKMVSKADETEGDFKARVQQAGRERRDLEVEKLRVKYAPKLQALVDQKRRAEQKLEKEKSQVKEQSMSTVLSIGATVLGAIFGRKLATTTNVNRAISGVKSASRTSRQKADVDAAEDEIESLDEKLATLNEQLKADTDKIQEQFDPAALEIEEVDVQPKKTDVTIGRVTLCWTPWTVDATGLPAKGW